MAAMPPWVQSGGLEQWIARLKQPAIGARVAAEMREPHPQGWESDYAGAGPEKTLLLAFLVEIIRFEVVLDVARGNPAWSHESGGMSARSIARLKITLNVDTHPVRHRIEVPLSIPLDRLNLIFLAAMDWTNKHFYEIRARDVGCRCWF